MTRLLRSCLLVFSMLAVSLSAGAQTSNCRITLFELLAPVACLGGQYQVGFTVSCPLAGPYQATLYSTISASNPAIRRDTVLAQASGPGSPVTMNIPFTLDTSRIYYIIVKDLGSGLESNAKVITVRPVDQSPAPRSLISIVPPVKAIYCPKDTITFQLDTLIVSNNYPPATYQWLRNGSPIPNQDRDRVRVTNLLPNDRFALLVTKGNACAINDTGSSNTIPIQVRKKPTLAINSDSGSGCADSLTVLRLDTANVEAEAVYQFFKNDSLIQSGPSIFYTLNAGFANCRDRITAQVVTFNCPDTVKADPFVVGSCGKVQVDDVTPTAFCAGDTLRITYSTFACFDPGNVFTFQLSDSSGSFATHFDAGSVVDSNGGVATGRVPADLPSGVNYRLRIVSSAPQGISLNSFGPLRVFARPQDVQPVPPNVRCGPGPVTVRVQSAGATSYAWYTAQLGGVRVTRPDGSLVTTDTFTVNVTRDTTFYVEAVNANGCTTAVRTPIPVQVGQPIQVSAGPDQFACERGACIQLIGGSPIGDGIYIGLGAAAGAVAPNSSFCPGTLPADTFRVRYIFTSNIGCKDSAEKNVIIQAVPTPQAGNDTAICATTSATQFQLAAGQPAGGFFSGSGVTAGGLVTVALLDTFNIITYTVSTDAGCSRADTLIIRVNRGPQVTVTTTPPLLCNTKTGTATVNPFDNTIHYRIDSLMAGGDSVAGIGLGPVFVGLGAGSYVLVADDGRNCPSQTAFVIQDLLAPVVTITGLAPAYCSSDTCITLTASITGGTFTADPAVTPPAVDSAGRFCPALAVPGAVTVFYTVRDTLTGCVSTDSATTTINQAPAVDAEGDTTVCLNSGLIALSSGGIWTGPGVVQIGATFFFNPQSLGVLQLPDSNLVCHTITEGGCATTVCRTIRVTPSVKPVITPTGPQVICQNGIVTISATVPGVTLPTPGISFVLLRSGINVGGSDSGIFRISQPGTYTVATVGSSCSDTSDGSVIISADSLGTVSAGTDTSLCDNANPVALVGTPAPGNGITGFFRDQFGNIISNFVPSSVPAGTTQVTVFYVVQRGACRDSARRIFTLLPAPTATVTAPSLTSCVTGIQLTGGPAGAGNLFTFIMGSTDTVQAESSVPTFTAITSGSYTVRIRVPGNVCADVSDPVILNISTPPVLPALTDIFACGSSSAIALETPAGVTAYTWTGPGVAGSQATVFTFNPGTVGPGTYTLKLVAQNGACADSATKGANVGTTPSIARVATTQTTDCNSADGTARVLFDPAAGADTANYIVTFIGDVTLIGRNIAQGAQGNYSARIYHNLTGCDTTVSFAISAPNSFQASIGDTVPAGFCAEELPFILRPDSAEPTGGQYYIYDLDNVSTPVRQINPPVIANLPTGHYRLLYSVTNSAGCIGRDTADFAVNNPGTPSVLGASADGDTTICDGNTLTLSSPIAPGRSFQWLQNGNPVPGQTADTLVVRQAGAYSVRVDSAGCQRTSQFVSVNVRANPVPAIAVVGGNATACQGQTLTLVATPTGSGYVWFLDGTATGDTTQQITVDTAGNYTVQVTNGTCVTVSPAQTITFNPLPAADAGPGGQVCVSTLNFRLTGFSPALSGTDVRFLEPYIAGDTFSPARAGIGPKRITLSVTAGGCTATDTATVVVVPGFTVNVNPAAATICAQSDTALKAIISPPTPGAVYTFQWFRNDTLILGATDSVFSASDTGSYTVRATVANSPDSCSATSIGTLIRNFPFTLPFAGRDTNFCANALPYQLAGIPAGGVYSGPGVEQSGRFTPSASVVGVNPVVFTTNQGECTLRDTINITVVAVPDVQVSQLNLVTGGTEDINILDSARLTATGADTYAWAPAESLSGITGNTVVARPRTTTQYTVVGTTSGCSATTQVTVTVRTDVRVSNGFSPNNDGQNDYWNIFNIQAYPDADIRVYNRWGALVYQVKGSALQTEGDYWNGVSDGKEQPVGAYYYTIDLNNNQKPFIGSVTLVR